MTDLRETCEKVLEGGLLMIEGVEDLTTQFEGDNVEDEIVETVDVMLSNTDDVMRQRRIIALLNTLGQRLNSEKLANRAQVLAQEWES